MYERHVQRCNEGTVKDYRYTDLTWEGRINLRAPVVALLFVAAWIILKGIYVMT